MINDPQKTSDEEILLISKVYGIPRKKIHDALNGNIRKVATKKRLKEKPIQPMNTISDLQFTDFEKLYLNAKSKEDEMVVIRKFIPACLKPTHAKILYEVCPKDEDGLKNEIILQWIKVCNNIIDLREVKLLTRRGTPQGDLAYRKYVELF